MSQYLLMCRSLTYAQRAAGLLERTGVTAVIIKAPQQLTGGGCGYALSIYRRVDEAVSLLRGKNMLSGKVFRRNEDGDYTEVSA